MSAEKLKLNRGVAMLDFGSLLRDHKAQIRQIPVAMIREYFPEVGNRSWQSWRKRADVPRASRSMSDLSALKLWVIARSGGRIEDCHVSQGIIRLIGSDPQGVEDWLLRHRWVVSPDSARAEGLKGGNAAVIEAITNLAPYLDVQHRGRLYEWFDKAGLKYSTKGSYSRTEIMRVVSVAKRGINKGRPRKGAAGARSYDDIAVNFSCSGNSNN
jgi:hypothetical protein